MQCYIKRDKIEMAWLQAIHQTIYYILNFSHFKVKLRGSTYLNQYLSVFSILNKPYKNQFIDTKVLKLF